MRLLLIPLVLIAMTASSWANESIRHDFNINRDWKFKLGDHPGAEATALDDSDWTDVNLPHSFDLPYFMRDFYVGYGWYRRHVAIEPGWRSKCVSVEFAGAFQDAEVYVNGTRLGEHKGGFTGFSMEITPDLHEGDNVVAVRLNNLWNAQIEPLSGDHTFMGGLYRDVHLVVTDPLHVTWCGTFVTTPQASINSAIVNVKTEIRNEAAVAKNCALTTDLLDPAGNRVAHLTSTLRIDAGATVIMDQTSPSLAAPRLWHPAHSFLYTATTTVSDGTTPVDDYSTSFGIRSIKWTADQGFFINGEHFYFHGANVHQDHAGWGDAVTAGGAYRDVQLVKDAGLDFIRGSHYPHHPAFADACDRIGVLFWSENCFWGCGGGKSEGSWRGSSAYPHRPMDQVAFDQNALDTLRDEIRIFRNHPSIIAWSMCNEVFFSDNQDKVKGLLTRLVDETHQLDPTRPAAIGGCQRGGLDKLGDVAGYNGDGAVMAEYQNPGFPSAVSEYGSHISDRGDARSDLYNGMFDARGLTGATPEYPWRSGQSLWCAFDYSTVLGHFGCMGFVDYFRIPKRSWYWYRNEYRQIPPPAWPQNGTPASLALTTDKTSIRGTDATDDCQLLVTVQDAAGKAISNSPPVTLTVESGPGEFPTGRSITFTPPGKGIPSDISIRDGMAAIEFRSYFGGKSVIRATSPGMRDGTVTVTTLGDPPFVAGKSPVAPDRPYVPLIHSPSSSKQQNVALNHPTHSSSDAQGHGAGLANDGNAGSAWQAAAPHPGAWWQIDLEALCSINGVETTFGAAGNYQYKIESSSDGKNWTLLVDQTHASGSDQVRNDTCAKNQDSRYLRLTFTGLPAGQPATIAEIKIYSSNAR